MRCFVRGEVDLFGTEQRTAFDDLRSELASTVYRLGFFDPNDPTELYVDASAVGLGAVLTQLCMFLEPTISRTSSRGCVSGQIHLSMRLRSTMFVGRHVG